MPDRQRGRATHLAPAMALVAILGCRSGDAPRPPEIHEPAAASLTTAEPTPPRPTCVPSAAQVSAARELYVADVFEIAGDAEREDALFDFASVHGITRLSIYGHRVLLLDTPDGEAKLRRFMAHARERGIRTLTAAVGWDGELDSLATYMRANPSASFDELVTEIEYWHDCEEPPTSNEGAIRPCFQPLHAMLLRMRALRSELVASGHPRLSIAAYLGWPSREEARTIAALVGRVLLHCEQPTPARAYDHQAGAGMASRARLRDFAGRADVWPIFYARGDANMGPWLASHGMGDAERAWTAELVREREAWACEVTIGGFAYFDYRAVAEAAGHARSR